MLKYIKIVVLVFACISAVNVKGQDNTSDFPSEEITVQTSQQLLFPGETLWFSVFSTNSLHETELSTLAFVELINSGNTSILRKKVKLNSKTGNSYFHLPDSLSTGIYRIIAYTNWMKNFDTNTLPYFEVSVVNPEQAIKPNHLTNGSKKTPKRKQPVDSYGQREKIELANLIEINKSMVEQFSVTVKRKEPKLLVSSERKSTSPIKKNGDTNYLPDYKGMVVSGKLYQANNELAIGQKVLLSLLGKGADLLSSTSDTNGKFSFLLSTTSASQDLVFTLPNAEMKLKLEDPFMNQHKIESNTVLKIDSLSDLYLQERYFYWQLAQKFGTNITEPAPIDTINESPFTFYASPNRSFLSKDYVFLDSLSEYFHELIPSVHFNRTKNNRTFDIINQKSKLSVGNNPGVFVDGVLYLNFNNIAKIPTNKLERIEVLWDKYHYKDFTFDGIVSIHTKTADFYSVDLQENMTRIIYPLSDKNSIQFKSKIYTESSITSKRPDLRSLLYWNPSASNDEFNKLHFYTSDIPGTYEVVISGYTENGNWTTLKEEFEVNE